MYNIPLFDLNFGVEEEQAVIATLKSKWISMGPKCEEFENTFANMLGVKYAVAVANCTAALHLACVAAGIGPGDEVICPSLSFAATANCIRYTGATPVFADVCGTDDLCVDPVDIERKITEKTKAIIPMHYAGYACDMGTIMALAEENDLAVIEDACHGPLSQYEGQKLGTIGLAGCFSFFSNKNLSTGEGGMIVTNDEDIYRKLKLLRSHGMTTMSYQRAQGHATKYDILELGYNYRMDDIRASIGIAQLAKLVDDLKKRADVRERYVARLQNVSNISIPFADRKEFSSNYIFPIVLEESTEERRDAFRDYLQARGVQTSVHYPAIHKFSIYRDFYTELPNTEYISKNELTLPMYASLTEDQVDYICDIVKEANAVL